VSGFVEPGRSVAESGRIVYDWPPQGRFAEIWRRLDAAVADADKCAALSLLNRWQEENSTLIAYTDDDGEWVDVESHYETVTEWLEQEGGPSAP
jgi:hypothetical protein